MSKKVKRQEDIEVQITPMLDMAFQLLTFFILTYRPAPTEGQFSMNLMPAAPAVEMQTDAPSDEAASNTEIPPALRTLTTQVSANADGTIGGLSLGENQFQTLDELKNRLKEIVGDKSLAFDQAVIEADPNLRYEELMRVIDVFAGDEVGLTKLSFTELGSGPGVGL